MSTRLPGRSRLLAGQAQKDSVGERLYVTLFHEQVPTLVEQELEFVVDGVGSCGDGTVRTHGFLILVPTPESHEPLRRTQDNAALALA